MAKKKNVFKKYTSNTTETTPTEEEPVSKSTPFRISKQARTLLGLFFLLLGFYLLLAFVSYLFTWKVDQDAVFHATKEYFTNKDITADNILGKFGAYISHQFFYHWVGISSFFIAGFSILFGAYLFTRKKLFSIPRAFAYIILFTIVISLITGFLFQNSQFPWGGAFGQFVNEWLQAFLGQIGTGLLYLFSLAAIVFSLFDVDLFSSSKTIQEEEDEFIEQDQATNTDELADLNQEDKETAKNRFSNDAENEKDVENTAEEQDEAAVVEEQPTIKEETINEEKSITLDETVEEDQDVASDDKIEEEDDSTFEIVKNEEEMIEEDDDVNLELEEVHEEQQAERVDMGSYDPTLDLKDYRFPKLSLLDDHGDTNIEIDREELEKNKNQIVQTLKNYKIDVSKIKATVGPTVTLYEIVPAPGIRISKIKNLEDDIALSLSALGIRIIAPIPGKGTIGIEVPNQHPNIVSMKSMVGSKKFVETNAELPIAIGKTISNENYIADLAKMPHLLIAGATGQGKSVGINAIIVSLLYQKHPSELKFILIDPKKVELSIYSKIEHHYLAKLSTEEEAIITDIEKVVETLNSLCIEMDERYDLLKDAHCRNIKEYNKKFKERRLNPENGHRYLPYMVLIVDEFADLIMTAGKEVESPIARLAQLARAVGIHLIIATQRPSVNIITGIIKANFPARLAYKVTSKVDSRTILDMGGADQLIGRGDLILSIGSSSTRLQGPFVDTPEVNKITSFIQKQPSYGQAHELPEYESDSPGTLEDDEEVDEYFSDAAWLVVNKDKGSTSMLQRKLSIGYNRAGRIMDQLEKAGIVGPQKGSKPREVLITNKSELEQFLENL